MKGIDVNTSKADQIYRWLLEEFAAGRIVVGDKLPSENELSIRFSVSRPQVRLALARLTHEGKVGTVRGKGSFRLEPGKIRNRDLAVVLPRLDAYIYPELVVAAGEAIRKRGYQALFDCSNGEVKTEKEILSRLIERKPAGLLMSPVQLEPGKATASLDLLHQIHSQGTDIVLIDNTLGSTAFSSIVLDDFGAGRRAAEYLLAAGHSPAVCWRINHAPYHERARGFLSVLSETRAMQPLLTGPLWKSVSVQEPSIHIGGPEALLDGINKNSTQTPVIDLTDAFSLLFRSKKRPTAFFCADDDLALLMRDAAKAASLRIPDDVSFIGYDDSPLAKLPEFSLSSFAYPSRMLGKRAAELLIDAIEAGPPLTRFSLLIEPVLMERDTVLNLQGEQ